jgi:hypothetical protein
VDKYLGGVHYPAELARLLKNAQAKGAPNDFVDLIKNLPDRTYTSPIDITEEIGKIK